MLHGWDHEKEEVSDKGFFPPFSLPALGEGVVFVLPSSRSSRRQNLMSPRFWLSHFSTKQKSGIAVQHEQVRAAKHNNNIVTYIVLKQEYFLKEQRFFALQLFKR